MSLVPFEYLLSCRCTVGYIRHLWHRERDPDDDEDSVARESLQAPPFVRCPWPVRVTGCPKLLTLTLTRHIHELPLGEMSYPPPGDMS